MPKKNGVMQTFSFKKETIEMLAFLGDYFSLKKTSVIEFLVKEKFREVQRVEKNGTSSDED